MSRGESIDWGLHQMNTCAERNEPADNLSLSLVTFGDHTLHHLFPTLDHSLLPPLQKIFEDTCKEFDLDLTPQSYTSVMCGQFKQLVRISPNNSKKKNMLKK